MARITVYRYHRPAALGTNGPATSPDYAKDALRAERWEFNLLASYGDGEVTLKPESYSLLARQTRRHQWRDERRGFNGSYWSRFDERSSGIHYEDVPFPEDVIAEAKAAVVVTFQHWKAHK